ncbi:MAG: phosphoribosylanthranilate isomerase [Chromatocurvus sp.]
MLRTRIKICGLTRPRDAEAASAQGVDALGLVFYSPSPRDVSIALASEIAAAVPPFVTLVALFVNPEAPFVERVIERLPIGMLQFHGDESSGFCEQFNMPYLKALRMRPDVDPVQEAIPYRSASGLLLDTYTPGVPGGTGEVFRWGAVPSHLPRPIVLAGGLHAGNVGEAISQVRPAAVDISTGVEVAPGEKDVRMIAGFIQAVRDADDQFNSETDE